MSDFMNVLRGPKWKDPKAGYRAYLDVDAAIDFHVLEVLSGNVDAMVLSTYFYKPRNGKITFAPHWDFDRAMGSIDERDVESAACGTPARFSAADGGRVISAIRISGSNGWIAGRSCAEHISL